MVTQTILLIILKSLELSIKLVDNMTPEQRQAFAERHEARMDFWKQLFERFQAKESSP